MSSARNRVFISLVVAFGLLAGSAGSQACAQEVPDVSLESAFGGMAAETILKSLFEKIDLMLSGVSGTFNFAAEKAADEAKLLLGDAQARLNESLGITYEALSIENQKIINSVDRVVAELGNAQRLAVDVQDMLAIDLGNTLNRLPFSADEYFLRRIRGWAVPYQETGAYRVELVGNAFGPDHWAEVRVSGKDLPSQNLTATSAGKLVVRIASTQLNPLFSEFDAGAVPFEVVCGKKGRDKPIYRYSGRLMLFPVRPYEYVLYEDYVETRPSGTKDGFIWGPSVFVDATDVEASGEEPSNYATARVRVPEGTRVLPSQYEADIGQFGKLVEGSQRVIGGGTGMSARFKSWKREGQEAKLGVGYETLVPTRVDAQRDLFRLTGGVLPGTVPFGITRADLHPDNLSFRLVITSFSGKKMEFTPMHLREDEVTVAVERRLGFARLLVKITPPE